MQTVRAGGAIGPGQSGPRSATGGPNTSAKTIAFLRPPGPLSILANAAADTLVELDIAARPNLSEWRRRRMDAAFARGEVPESKFRRELFAITATANHFLLDAAGGLVAVGTGLLLLSLMERGSQREELWLWRFQSA